MLVRLGQPGAPFRSVSKHHLGPGLDHTHNLALIDFYDEVSNKVNYANEKHYFVGMISVEGLSEGLSR